MDALTELQGHSPHHVAASPDVAYLPALAPDPIGSAPPPVTPYPTRTTHGGSQLYPLPPACRVHATPHLISANLRTHALALLNVGNASAPPVWKIKASMRGEKLGGLGIAAARGGLGPRFNVLVLCASDLDRNRAGASAIGAVPVVRCYDGADGAPLWKMGSIEGANAYLTNGGGIRLHMAGATVSGDGAVLFVSQLDGVVWCLSAATGEWLGALHGQPSGSSHSFFRGYTHEIATPPCICAPYAGEVLVTCARDHAATGDMLRGWRVGAPLRWSRDAHHRFPPAFKDAVRQLLLCVSRARRGLADAAAAPAGSDAAHARAVLDAMARELGIVDSVVAAMAEAWCKLDRRRRAVECAADDP